MIRSVVRHEWTLMRREPVAWWAAALLLVATMYALVGGRAWQESRLDETVATHDEGASMLAEQRAAAEAADTGGRVGSARTFAALPPGPLAAFSVGLGDLFPQRAEISIWKRPDTLFGRYQLESPLSLLVGRFDLAFVVVFLLPLFVLALSYDLLSREREGGTLMVVLMQPISLPGLVAAKLLARLLVLTAFLVGVLGVGALATGLPASSWPRLLGWGAVAWLYGAFWLAVCGLVATFTRRSETCAAVLAAVWLTFLLVVPGLLNVAVQVASPVPSRLDFVIAMREASTEASRASAKLLAEYYHEHPELASNGSQGGFLPAFYASEREVERRLEPLMDDYEQRLTRQQQLVGLWRFVSPAVLAQEALIELAGSGLERQRSSNAQARDFLARWHEALAPKIFLGESLLPSDYDRLPSFEFAEPPVSFLRFFGAVLGLLLPSLGVLMWTRRRLDRMPTGS